MSGAEPLLQVCGVQKAFDGFMAVQQADLTVERGEIVAVIGPNGAGKTTLFHLITGQIAPDRGEVRFKGCDLAGWPPHRICRRGISRSYQVVSLFGRLSVLDNVRVAVLSRQGRALHLFTAADRLAVAESREILATVGLADKGDRPCATLSHGDQKVLEIAVALGSRPELLILDEPTAGMSPEETGAALALMRRLSGEMGLTILFCEHDMELVFAFAHRIMVMHQGRSIIQDTPAVVRADRRVQAAYLGGGCAC
jgi:branched-chain amino acid transport system ATP-binding protein